MRASPAHGSWPLLWVAPFAMAAIDVAPMWDFSDPAASEARFVAALVTSQGDDTLILRTQIARSYGLRGDVEGARRELAGMEGAIATAGAEARARYFLELGRTWASATTAAAQRTDETRAKARAAYASALSIARDAHLDDLAIDAIHMDAFVDSSAANELRAAREALAIATSSPQPAARRWEASLRNNIGYALHELGRYDEALVEFDRALVLRRQRGDIQATRSAQWMVAWTLRSLGRHDEALAIQLALAREYDAAGTPDADVYAELEALYRARGDVARAEDAARRRQALEAAAAPHS